MSSRVESSLRRRMLATIALFVVCAVSFVGTLAVLYGYVVPTMLAWWGREFDLQSEIGLVAVVVPAGIVLLLAIGSVPELLPVPAIGDERAGGPGIGVPRTARDRPPTRPASRRSRTLASRSRLERPERVHRRSHAEFVHDRRLGGTARGALAGRTASGARARTRARHEPRRRRDERRLPAARDRVRVRESTHVTVRPRRR